MDIDLRLLFQQYLHNFTDDDDDEELPTKLTSPSREVSPKFVVAGKKYGRRSRPPSDAFDSSQSDTDPECTSNDMTIVPNTVNHQRQHDSTTATATTKTTQKVQRSSSHSEIHGGSVAGTARKRRPTSGSKLKRCASLPAQKKKEEKLPTLSTQHHESSVESLGNLDFENLSHSLHEVWTDFGQGTDSYLYRADLVKVCERVGLSVKIAAKVADEVFEKLELDPHTHRISFGEFISLIQSDTADVLGVGSSSSAGIHCLADRYASADDVDADGGADDSLSCISSTMTVTGRTERSITRTQEISPAHELHASHSAEWPVESSAVDIEVIVDMWDSAGIPNSRSLLDSLGFRSKEIRISQLSLAIDDNLQGTNGQENTMLRASLALHKAEVNALQHAFRQLATQNKKLHANNRDVNRRAALLAQEVDERHTHLENSARSEIRQLEMRHTDIVRDLTAQLANDREHWAGLTFKLEQRIKSLESDDVKMRLECQQAQQENSLLESEQILLQKQITELLEENIKLNNDIVEVGERQRTEDSAKDDRDNEELLELMEKISVLQMENANLRDKNDELVSEVEEKAVELTKLRGKKQPRLIDVICDSETDLTPGSSATKRRGDSPSKAKMSEESPKLGKLRKCSNEMSDAADSEGSGDWMALNSELNQSAAAATQSGTATTSGFSQEFSSLNDCKDEEIKLLKKRVADLETELSQSNGTGDSDEFRTRNQELEASLEQMRKEFEDLEDYWQGKLMEERQLYETEQQKSNDKFDDLLKKMAEYEEQFLTGLEKDGRLSPIEEKYNLEQQYADLEAEIEEIKNQAREMLDQKSNEVNDLQSKLKRLQHRVIDSAASESQASVRTADGDSPASSPISYLWHQSTIQQPARDYHNPNYNAKPYVDANLNITDTFSEGEVARKAISPIQRPSSPYNNTGQRPRDGSDASSVRSFGTHSVASTHSVHKTFPEAICTSPNNLREEIKRLKMMELQLKDGIQELSQVRNCLVMELQHLQEAKPALEKAYATNHPSLQQRITQLEQRNRNLQHCLKQQQQYAETVVHQSWQQQRSELSELHHRLEGQGIIISEQSQRLANTDILVKELYVENSQLSAAVQRLEQQRSRNSLILQHQGLTGVPGMPSI